MNLFAVGFIAERHHICLAGRKVWEEPEDIQEDGNITVRKLRLDGAAEGEHNANEEQKILLYMKLRVLARKETSKEA
jgi:hypothetical protein